MNSRICIVGANGSGKRSTVANNFILTVVTVHVFLSVLCSTVIKLITEELKPPEGEIRRNPKLRVGVYNQHFVDRLPMEEDPVTYLRRLFNEETYQTCRHVFISHATLNDMMNERTVCIGIDWASTA